MTMCAFIALGLALISKDENVKRPLPYPIWLFDHDLQESPAYEILFVASVIFTVFHTKQLICKVPI